MRDQSAQRGRKGDDPPGIAKVRGAADRLEAAIVTGQFTLDEQLPRLLKGH